MIGKFGELSYHMKKNSTKWNSRAEARLRQQTFSLGAKCASPGGLLYDREVRRTFLSYKKERIDELSIRSSILYFYFIR